MKKKITKTVKGELKAILDKSGYWSEEAREYIEQFEYYHIRQKLHNMSQVYCKYGYGL